MNWVNDFCCKHGSFEYSGWGVCLGYATVSLDNWFLTFQRNIFRHLKVWEESLQTSVTPPFWQFCLQMILVDNVKIWCSSVERCYTILLSAEFNMYDISVFGFVPLLGGWMSSWYVFIFSNIKISWFHPVFLYWGHITSIKNKWLLYIMTASWRLNPKMCSRFILDSGCLPSVEMIQFLLLTFKKLKMTFVGLKIYLVLFIWILPHELVDW
jgi:hypothetical protein